MKLRKLALSLAFALLGSGLGSAEEVKPVDAGVGPSVGAVSVTPSVDVNVGVRDVNVAPQDRRTNSNFGAQPQGTQGNYPSGWYYNNGYYPYQGWLYDNRCLMFYNYLWLRLGSYYPLYFPAIRSNDDLFLTPEAVRIALRDAMQYADDLQATVKELGELIRLHAAQKGKVSSEDAKRMRSLADHVKNLSQKIRDDQFLAIMDLRKERDLAKDLGKQDRSAEAILRNLEALEKMVGELHQNISDLYNQKSPGVVSVQEYNGTSLRSIAKGIERIAKRIELGVRAL